jgi:histidinol-phosphatase (PHP family)
MINFKQDTHIHTNYSPDADKTATFKKYIDKAKELGLKEIIFTDHVDFDPAHPLFKVPIDYDKYIKDFKNLTKNNQGINVKLGVEIGYQTHVKEEIETFLKTYPFEHVILSIHYLEKKDLYTKDYFQGKTKKEAYTIYFEKVLEAVNEIDDFSVVGHLDYIPRYSDFGDYEYTEYQTIIDQILTAIINKNKGIEINTSGFNYEGRQYPKKEVVDRFVELGGTIITIGSDSHTVDELTRNYEKIEKIL